MTDLPQKAMLIGLGLLVMTKEKGESVLKELEDKGASSKDEVEKILKDLSSKGSDFLQKDIGKFVEQAVKKLNLASRDEVAKLKQEINALKKAKK